VDEGVEQVFDNCWRSVGEHGADGVGDGSQLVPVERWGGGRGQVGGELVAVVDEFLAAAGSSSTRGAQTLSGMVPASKARR
jgi:hypothetical protein